ncbi:PorT family protein [Chitinophaga horti]|uniref:PorT family protein n=1 Tax=Chitinophaga horti TaxID=2920382 RepID=A0ABY6IZX6_9BACT|nr:porin family protein [Chitinophaga horti]UYQ92946.1 PorT family protein [Chitinophaga horti]
MKKVLLSAAALFIAGLSFGQVKYGIVVGPNFSSMTSKLGGEKHTSDLKVGVRAGFTADIPLADDFYVQPSLLYANKGGKEDGEFFGLDYSYKTNLHYLNVPVNFLFKPEVGTGNMILGVGPYFAWALSGKSGDNDIEFGSDEMDHDLKRFDSGGNLQVGYELKNGLNFVLHAEMGFINLAPGGDSDNAARTNSFGVSVGYKFGR